MKTGMERARMKSLWIWTCAGLASTALATAHAAPQKAQASTSHPNFDGVWQVERRYNVQTGTVPDDGSPVPFLLWNQPIYDAAKKALAAGDPFPPNNQRCLVEGTMRAWKGNFPWEMVQTDRELVVLFEEDGRVNQIPFRSEHKRRLTPTWYGDPIARWDGDTVVVDTIGFNEKTQFIPAIWHTTDLHTVMRIRLINGGKNLEVRTTIDDPGAFIHPWETLLVFDRTPPTYKLRDYRCIENNQDLPKTGAWGPG
jgi:hypothetical protein